MPEEINCSKCRRQHVHGELATYNSANHRCRCPLCRSASATSRSRSRRAEITGIGARSVSAGPAQERLRILRSRGMTIRRIAAEVGLSSNSISTILGFEDAESRRIHSANAEAILAIHPPRTISDVSDTMRGPAKGTRTRLQALQALGWSVRSIATQAGLGRSHLTVVLNGGTDGDLINARTMRLVAEVYERLWDTRPPRKTPQQRNSVSRSLRRAAESGWKPPMAHDDDRIDLGLGRVTLCKRKPIDKRERQSAGKS